jgi:hypothetical protein
MIPGDLLGLIMPNLQIPGRSGARFGMRRRVDGKLEGAASCCDPIRL